MGSPAARLGDPTVHGGVIVVGLPTVMIGNQPASRIGDMHVCPMVTVIVPHVGGPLILGSFTVLTGGVPQSRVGDMLICIGPPDAVEQGCPTVMVGMAGGGMGLGAILSSGLAAGLGNFLGATQYSSAITVPSPHTQKYATPEEAAVAQMKASNPASVKEGREYGGWVHKNSDGTYSPDPPTRGGKDGLTNMPDKGANDVVWWHTHGANDPGYDNENFSGATGDEGYSKANNAVGYLATPTGVIKRYDPTTDTVTTLPIRRHPR